jgi:lysophospholipase L1-like esterase
MKDYRSEPVLRMVTIGESNAFGMCAIDSRNEWVQTVGNLIRDFQDKPIQIFNNSIPANVIGPESPGYGTMIGTKPSALERYKKDLIAHKPDLAIIAYGLNDSRCGYAAEKFLRDLETIVSDIKKEIDCLVVLTSPYWNPQFNPELWNSLEEKPNFGAFNKVGRELVWSYVEGIRKLAERYDCIFVDLFTTTEKALWLLHDDKCHYNDVGQRVLGQIVFNTIAAKCSFVGKKSIRQAQEGRFSISNTGGTNAMSKWVKIWIRR